MKPKVFWFNDCRGSWCHAIIDWLTAECEHVNGTTYEIGRDDDTYNPAIVVLKADDPKLSWTVDGIRLLNKWMKAFRSVLVIVTANEEGDFPVQVIQHPRMRMWIQTPTRAQRQWASCGIPWGWTPGFDGTRWLERLPGYEATEADRMLDFSFAGQVTHSRREECVFALEMALDGGANGTILKTSGFGKGLPRHLYFELMMNTKLAPCPSGPVTVDSFRVWEALEAGCVPLVDSISPTMDAIEGVEYWDYITGMAGETPPFAATVDWKESIPRALEDMKDNWPREQRNCIEWWARRKEFWKKKFATDLEMLRIR